MKVAHTEHEAIRILDELGYPYETANLEVGDFVIRDHVLERKKYLDFVATSMDDREQQFIRLLKLQEEGIKVSLLIEGFDSLDEHRRLMVEKIAELTNAGINVICLRNTNETVHYLHKLDEDPELDIDPIGRKIHGPPFEVLLRSVPKIGKKNAKDLIEKHKSWYSLLEYIRTYKILTTLEKRVKNYLDSAVGFNKEVIDTKETYYIIIDKNIEKKDAIEDPKLIERIFTDKQEAKTYAKTHNKRALKTII